ncbi:MAG: hypothetical protein GY909_08910 [Oligoflexia bacterium]|nr:hypothetical protein [Oligoflexia bacterium]
MSKKNELEKRLYERMWALSGALKGVGALLKQQDRHPCYGHEELFGLGQFLEISAEELSDIEETLRCRPEKISKQSKKKA